jgi:predicted esterase
VTVLNSHKGPSNTPQMPNELHSNDFRLLGILNRKITVRYLHDASAPADMHELAVAAQAAFEAHDFAVAYRFMTRLLLRHRGFEINEATEVATALDFKLDRRLLVPGDPLTITLEPILVLESPPRNKFTATFVLRDRAGRMEEALPSIAVQEMRTYRVPVETSTLAAGRHSIVYKLHGPDGRSLVECPRDFVVDPDARHHLHQLEDRFRRLEPENKSGQPIAITSARETIEFVLMQMSLALKSYHAAMNHKSFPMTIKLRGVDMARYDNDPFESARDLPLVESLVSDLEVGRDPFSTRTGDMRLAFRSQLDGELQPFRVFVPEARQHSAKLPAVIALHGATGDENTYFDRYSEPKTGQNLFKKLGQEFGFLLAAPNGRGPFGMYTGNSERDVLETLDRVQALFPIDRQEIFLTGHSMGGMGTWSLGFRYADRFAALAPVAGRPGDLVIPLLDQAPEKPVLFVAGLNDVIVTPAKTSEWARIAQRHLKHFEYREYPRDDHFSIGLSSMPAIFEFFDAQRGPPSFSPPWQGGAGGGRRHRVNLRMTDRLEGAGERRWRSPPAY